MSAPCGAMPEGSERRSLDLSAFAREGAWCLRLQTKGQRKGPAVPKLQPSTLRNLFPLKCVERRACSRHVAGCGRKSVHEAVCRKITERSELNGAASAHSQTGNGHCSCRLRRLIAPTSCQREGLPPLRSSG